MDLALAAPSAASTSSTLWATASKEWIIPAKPKPGRKPKKDPSSSHSSLPDEHAPSSELLDTKGRRVQNRAAQRAFRERKQTQLAELQARILQYEQGEIERNVALQAVSKRLKEENENLRKENSRLLAELDNLRSRAERKRSREDDAVGSDTNYHKKLKQINSGITGGNISLPGPTPSPNTNSSLGFTSSPSPLASSPDESASVHSALSPPNYPTPVSSTSSYVNIVPSSDRDILLARGQALKTSGFGSGIFDSLLECGFCSDEASCVCRELAMRQSPYSNRDHVHNVQLITRSSPATPIQVALATSPHPLPAVNPPSILDNPPAFQPPMPLKKRSPTNVIKRSIFPVISLDVKEPVCSGNPANCAACADDPFGQAFCAALDDAVASKKPCASCPDAGCAKFSVDGPTGNIASTAAPKTTSWSSDEGTDKEAQGTSKTIPRADAWRQLKSHPNAAFADLRMLAEVVARRELCAGPSIEISQVALDNNSSGLQNGYGDHNTSNEDNAIILTDPHAKYHERHAGKVGQNTDCSLVPQEVLIKCGRRRQLNVHAEGVRDALRLLDARFKP